MERVDTYSSYTIVFHVLYGSAYTCGVPTDLAGSYSDRLCSAERSIVCPPLPSPLNCFSNAAVPFFYSDFGFVRHGIFRLREPKGLEAIIKCKRSELFHEHPDVSGGIYTDTNGGHGGAVKVREMALEVIDLREK